MEKSALQTFHSIGTTTDWIVMIVYFIVIMLFGSYFGDWDSNNNFLNEKYGFRKKMIGRKKIKKR